jgi:hypothetical protein
MVHYFKWYRDALRFSGAQRCVSITPERLHVETGGEWDWLPQSWILKGRYQQTHGAVHTLSTLKRSAVDHSFIQNLEITQEEDTVICSHKEADGQFRS